MRSTLQKASLFDVGVIWVIPEHSRGSDAGRHSRVKAIALQGAFCLPFDSGYTFAWSRCTSWWPLDEDLHQMHLGTYPLGPDARCIFPESRCQMLLVTGRGVPVAFGEDIHRRESPRQRMPHAHLTSPLPGRGLGPVVDQPEIVLGMMKQEAGPTRYAMTQCSRSVATSYPSPHGMSLTPTKP